MTRPSPRGTAQRIPPRWLKPKLRLGCDEYVVGSVVNVCPAMNCEALAPWWNGSGVAVVETPVVANVTIVALHRCWVSAAVADPDPVITTSTHSPHSPLAFGPNASAVVIVVEVVNPV